MFASPWSLWRKSEPDPNGLWLRRTFEEDSNERLMKVIGLFHGTRPLMAIHIGSDKLLEKSGLTFKTVMDDLAFDIAGDVGKAE